MRQREAPKGNSFIPSFRKSLAGMLLGTRTTTIIKTGPLRSSLESNAGYKYETNNYNRDKVLIQTASFCNPPRRPTTILQTLAKVKHSTGVWALRHSLSNCLPDFITFCWEKVQGTSASHSVGTRAKLPHYGNILPTSSRAASHIAQTHPAHTYKNPSL